MKICWKYIHLQVIRDVDEFALFFRTDLDHYSPMDPMEWMGAVRMKDPSPSIDI